MVTQECVGDLSSVSARLFYAHLCNVFQRVGKIFIIVIQKHSGLALATDQV